MTNLRTPDYSVASAAAQLAVSKVTIYKLLRIGALKFYKCGKATRITVESVQCFRETGGTA